MSLAERYRDLRRTLPDAYWVVWVGTLINRAGGFVVPLLTFYLTRERGMSLVAAGAIVSLYGAGQVVAALVGGVLADRLGRRATMAISLLGGSVLMLVLGLVTEPAAIAAATLAVGFVAELYRPAVSAFVADVVPPQHRLRAYGFLHWAINIGFSIAPLAAGLVAGWSYLALFVIDAVTMAVYGVVVLVRLPETRPAHVEHAPRASLAVVLRDGAFMTFWTITFLLALVIFQSTTTLSGWMLSQGHGEAVFGAVLAVNGALIVLFQPAITEAVRDADRTRVLAFAALVTGAGFAVHGTSALVAVHVAAVMVWTLGEITSMPTCAAVVADMATPDARGRYQGMFGMTYGLAAFLGPLLGPRVLEHGGPAVLWGGCLAVGVVAGAAYLVTDPGRRARPTR
jgi:MFS family permease